MSEDVSGAETGVSIHRHLGGKEGLTYVVANGVVNAANFAFHVLVSRQLGPAPYGEVSALLNVVTFLSIPLVALQAAVVQEVVGTDEQRTSMRRLLRMAAIGALGLTGLLAALSPFVAGFLALGSVLPVIVLSLWLAPSIEAPVLAGTLMGRLRFRAVAYATVTGAAVRLGATAVFGSVHMGVEGPLVATVLGASTSCLLLASSLVASRRRAGHAGVVGASAESTVLRVKASTMWQTLAALGGYSVLVGIDTIVARHFMSAATAGLYASAATGGRIALFLPGAVTTVVFPRFVARRDHPDLRRDLFVSAVLIGGVGLSVAAVMIAFPHVLITVLFGSRFQAAAPELRLLGVEAAMLGQVSLFTYFHLSRRSLTAGVPWVTAVAVVLVSALARPGPVSLAVAMLGLTAATAVVMGTVAWITLSKAVPEDEVSPGWPDGIGVP